MNTTRITRKTMAKRSRREGIPALRPIVKFKFGPFLSVVVPLIIFVEDIVSAFKRH